MRRVIYCLLLSICCALSHAIGATDDDAIAQAIRTRFTSTSETGQSTSTLDALTLPQAVAQFYAGRNYKPAWTDHRHVEQLLKELDNLRDDGLNPDDYHLTQLHTQFAQLQNATAKITANSSDIARRADFDLLASNAYLHSLAHLFRGKVNPKTLSSQWNFAPNDMAAAEAMKIVNTGIDSGDLAAVYQRARPQQPFYARGRAGLAQLRAIAAQGGWPQISDVTLKPGDKRPEVAVLRQRFFPNVSLSSNDSAAQSDIYDETLAAAVRKFQNEQYLGDDGVVGAATRAALNTPVQTRIDQLRVNLERGRWLLHELQDDFVLVDVAGYKIVYFKNGKPVWRSNVQVGKPYRSTPIFKSNITHITLNPTWTVPPTILRNDVLPKVRRDIGYLAKNNMRVFDNRGRELNPSAVNWNNPGSITLRQDAGEHAALGQVAIRFPNEYAVYLHDTPHRELFSSHQRAFSSGCIRVERPFELIELLFNDPEKWSRANIDQMLATGETRNVILPKPVPVLLAYWTVDLYEDGDISYKPDIYKRDGAVLKALNARL